MYKVFILPSVKKDITEIALWYNLKQKGLGKRFTTNLRRKINRIKANPDGYAIRYDEVRTALIEVFPFMIHFAVDESQNEIIIYAILHTSRNPDLWRTGEENSDVDH